MAKDDWCRVSPSHPCPVCGKPDNCSTSRDGGAAYCGRVEEGSIRQNDGGQFLHRLNDRGRVPRWTAERSNPRPPASKKPRPPSAKDFAQIAEQAFYHPQAESARIELAELLGVSADALRRLRVGWLAWERAWTFPERDAIGRVIGISRRFRDSSKRRMSGSACGLTYDPESWLDSAIAPYHLFLVEGGSDTAALMTLGLSVVGRPSNLGGIDFLVERLKDVPHDRVLVVLGELDCKAHNSLSEHQQRGHRPNCEGCSKCWPGLFGAQRTAEQISARLGRRIAWSLPPDGAKDAREWLKRSAKIEEDQA